MKAIVLFISLLPGLFLYSQTADEWTRQKKTQIKYLMQQIAALSVYVDYAAKGYKIVNSGLKTIKDIKNGDFNLHSDFFTALKDVNPKIKNSARVADIIAFQFQIIKQIKSVRQHARQSGQFTTDEIGYFKNVLDRLLNECDKSLDELITVTTSGQLEMKDDERIKRIDLIYEDMQEKLMFCKSFSKEMSLLAIQRMAEQNEVNRSRKIFGLE